MTSIQEVADQINAKLDSITTNTSQSVTIEHQIEGELATISNQVLVLDGHLQSGLANVADGLFAIWEVDKAQLVELRTHTEQHDAVICLLTNTNELLCGITRTLSRQLELTRSIDTSLHRVEGIAERTEADAAGDYDRLQALTGRVERCCPDEQTPPEPCPEACKVPDHRPYRPAGQGWKPQHPDDKAGGGDPGDSTPHGNG